MPSMSLYHKVPCTILENLSEMAEKDYETALNGRGFRCFVTLYGSFY